MNSRVRLMSLCFALVICCLLFGSALQAATPSIDTAFDVLGNAKGGLYKKIHGLVPGGSLVLELERKTNLVNIGGLLVEGNPTFNVTGTVAEHKVALKIIPEDIIADVGGMKVQTGTVYHVTGTLADKPIAGEVTEDETISDFGGMKVVTETWATFKSRDSKGPRFEVRRVSVVADLGGFKVEQDRYNTCQGRDRSGKIALTMRDWVNDEDTIRVSGTGSSESLALLLALRPFLNI